MLLWIVIYNIFFKPFQYFEKNCMFNKLFIYYIDLLFCLI